MQKFTLGNTEIRTAPIIFGGNVLGWTMDEKTSFEVLDRFVDLGFNTIDTADVYSRWADGNSGGESETILGKWMKERSNRERLNVITKVGSDLGQGSKCLRKDYIIKACEDSLRRLQTDSIDLYFSHWDHEETHTQETLEAYDQLIQQGKVRFIGASNILADRLAHFLDLAGEHNLPRYEVVQPKYNLYDRKEFESELAEFCLTNSLGVITYSSLADGFLTGKYRGERDKSQSVRGKKMDRYLNNRGTQILAELDRIAHDYNTSPAAVSLAWLIQNERMTVPIASATSTDQLQAFKEATDMHLDQKTLQILEEASAYE